MDDGRATLWSAVRRVPGVIIDHIGIAVADAAAAASAYRALGFQVSAPVPLSSADGPLGQESAHIVFENGYVELASPLGDGGHLASLLAHGEGIRILALRSIDIKADHRRMAARGLASDRVQAAARTGPLAGEAKTARFAWFPVAADRWPGLMIVMVEHLTPETVFAPSLCAHPNGAARLVDIAAADGTWDDLAGAGSDALDAPALLACPGAISTIAGYTVAAPAAACHAFPGHLLRMLADAAG